MNLTYPVDALVSYHFYRTGKEMQPVTSPGHLRLIGDSGAFSAYTDGQAIRLGEYAEWCQQWGPRLCWTAALDVIGDPDASWRNWLALRDRHHLDTVPTLHAGGDVKHLDAYAAEGVDFVGLGGLVGVARRAMRWLVHVFRYARDHHPGMRFHLWGTTNRKILQALPAYSVDSSGIMAQAYRYGKLWLFDPRLSREVQIPLDGTAPHRHRDLCAGIYGVEPALIERSSLANRVLLVRLTAVSIQRYATWLQARHKVTPPAWGVRPGSPEGPRIHVLGNMSPADDDLVRLRPGRDPAP